MPTVTPPASPDRPIIPWAKRHPVSRQEILWSEFARDNETKAAEIFDRYANEFKDEVFSIVTNALQGDGTPEVQRELIAAEIICLVQKSQRYMIEQSRL